MKKQVWIMNHYAINQFSNRGGRHYWFAKHLLKKGYEPTIFCANTYHNKNDFIDTKNQKYLIDEKDDIPFVFVKTSPALGNGIARVKNMVLFSLNLYSVAKKIAKEKGNPDVIIASSVHPLTMIAGIKIAEKLGIPCICEIRDLWPEAIFAFDKARENTTLGKILISGEHWIYKNADALIFTKEGDTDYIKEKKWDIEQGGDISLNKCYYINNGVDLKDFKELSSNKIIKDEDLTSGKFNVTYVGTIRPVNNVGNILDAASIIKDEKEIQFLIYGDGSEKEMLEERILEENLSNVKIKGFVEKSFIPYILSESSVNILNYSQTQYNWSRGNSSNKLFEYMASGNPIISTVKMGYSIINKYKCGFELSNSTPNELASSILKIKNMPKEDYHLLGENAKAGAKDFDFESLTGKLIEVIESVYYRGTKNKR